MSPLALSNDFHPLLQTRLVRRLLAFVLLLEVSFYFVPPAASAACNKPQRRVFAYAPLAIAAVQSDAAEMLAKSKIEVWLLTSL